MNNLVNDTQLLEFFTEMITGNIERAFKEE